MQALRITQTISSDGFLHVAVPPEMGRQFEIIVLSLDEHRGFQGVNTAAMQEKSGFVQQVLGSADEDVWNDL